MSGQKVDIIISGLAEDNDECDAQIEEILEMIHELGLKVWLGIIEEDV